MKFSAILALGVISTAVAAPVAEKPAVQRDEAEVNAFGNSGRWTVKREADDEAEVNAFGNSGRWTVKRDADEAEVNAFGNSGRWTVKREAAKRAAKAAGEVDI